MAHTHEYDCIVCGAHFDSEKDLDRHNQERHEPHNAAQVAHSDELAGNDTPRKDPERQ